MIIKSYLDVSWPPLLRAAAGGGEPPQPTGDANLWGWFRSDTGISDNGGVVNRGPGGICWDDQSGNGYHFQENLGDEPGYTASGPNGKPAIVWADGTSKAMRSNTGSRSQPHSMFALVKPVAWTNNRYIWDGSSNFSALIQNGSTPNVQPYAGNFGPAVALTVGSWQIITVIYDGASSVIQINNDTEQTGNFGSINPGGILLGQYNGGGSNSAAFELAALIQTSVHADNTARALHKAWLAWYGGLTI